MHSMISQYFTNSLIILSQKLHYITSFHPPFAEMHFPNPFPGKQTNIAMCFVSIMTTLWQNIIHLTTQNPMHKYTTLVAV